MKLLLFLIIGILFNAVTASKVLFLLPISSKSHKNVFDPLIEEMATRGHEVTVISALFSSKNPKIKEIVPVPYEEIFQSMDDAFKIRKQGRLSFLKTFNTNNTEVACHKMYQNEEIKALMKEQTFDLVIMNAVMNQCGYGLVYHFQTPIILITTLPAPAGIAAKVGNHFPSSFVPTPFFTFTDRMTFTERGLNMLFNAMSHYFFTSSFEPVIEKIYQQYLDPNTPSSVAEIDRNISMIFMNSHMSMTYPRPLLPSVVEIGGMHCRPSKSPPKEIDDFISGAEHGFILFSLGSIVKAHQMPEPTRKVILNVFSRLKQRVIWKWETEIMPDLPANVKISKWLPQQDILGHKNIRLFITHGGLLSTQEAVYHGVPVVGFPIFGDQDLNMKQAENAGYGLSLEILDLAEEQLESAILRVLNEPRFTEKAKGLSTIFRDRQQTSLQTAVYWTEYVLRHKGAPHLQSSAKDLNAFQYHSIDVIGFLVAVLLVTIWILKLLVWNILVKRIICRSKQSSITKSSKSKKDK